MSCEREEVGHDVAYTGYRERFGESKGGRHNIEDTPPESADWHIEIWLIDAHTHIPLTFRHMGDRYAYDWHLEIWVIDAHTHIRLTYRNMDDRCTYSHTIDVQKYICGRCT